MCALHCAQFLNTILHRTDVKIFPLPSYVQNVHRWHKHKHTSVLAIGQLRHQSVTARSLATHAADTVAAHRFHESDSDMKVTSYLRHMAFIPVSRYLKIIKIHHDFPKL